MTNDIQELTLDEIDEVNGGFVCGGLCIAGLAFGAGFLFGAGVGVGILASRDG